MTNQVAIQLVNLRALEIIKLLTFKAKDLVPMTTPTWTPWLFSTLPFTTDVLSSGPPAKAALVGRRKRDKSHLGYFRFGRPFGRRLPQKAGFWIRESAPVYLGERRSSLDRSSRNFSKAFFPANCAGRVGLKTFYGQPNSQRLALAAYLPTPALGMLTASRRNDIIIVGRVYHFERPTITFSCGRPWTQAEHAGCVYRKPYPS